MKIRVINLLMVISLTAILSLSLAGCGVNLTAGEGEKIGQIVKVSNVGTFSNSWEAQLIRGGLTDGSGAFGVKPFDFTIESEEMVKKAQEYMKNQTEVIIKYRIAGTYDLMKTESGGIFLVSIEPAPKSK